MKNKIDFYFKNSWCWINSNKIYFLTSSIFFILIGILLVLHVGDLLFSNFFDNLVVIKVKNLCDVLIILFSLIFAYLFGNYNHIYQKRIKVIKDYFKDLDDFYKKLITFQKEIKNLIFDKKEIIYKNKEICKFMDNLINKFQKEKIELFSFDSWKLSTQFYKETNVFFKNFIYNYDEFKKAIITIKNTNNLNNDEIDNFIEIFIQSNKEKYFQDFLNKINLNNNEILKIIFQVNNFINFLTNDSIDILVTRLSTFVSKSEEKIKDTKRKYIELLEVCYEHEHFLNIRKNKCFCWITICKVEKIIYPKNLKKRSYN